SSAAAPAGRERRSRAPSDGPLEKTRPVPALVLAGLPPGALASRLHFGLYRAVSVAKREPLHARRQPLAWYVLGEGLGQLLQPQRFGARTQQEMQKVEVLNPLRELEAELRVAELRLARRRPVLELRPVLVQPQRLSPYFAGRRLGFIIVKVSHLAAQV